MRTAAIVFVRQEEAALQWIDMPPPGPGEVQIRTEYSTISAGTEGWAFRQLFTWAKTPFPCVPGYQRVGVITAIGEGVEHYRVGMRVMATTGVWSGDVKPFWGAHIALANTAIEQILPLWPEVNAVDASAAVVAQVGYNAAKRALPQTNSRDWAVVYGDGLIGQCAALAAEAYGLRVIVVGHRQERLALAKTLGASAVIDSHTENVVEAVRAYTGEKTIKVVLDSVQTEESQGEYVPLLENARGQIVYCGFTPGTAWADMGLLQQKELTTHYVSGWNRHRMDATLALMAEGKMPVHSLVTHLVPYARGPEMYRLILEKSEPFLGITLDWTGDDACES